MHTLDNPALVHLLSRQNEELRRAEGRAAGSARAWRRVGIMLALTLAALAVDNGRIVITAFAVVMLAACMVGGVLWMIHRGDAEIGVGDSPQCDWPCCDCTVCHRDCGGTCME